jgi:predicted DNA-binding transcriptional regulator YafY
MASVLCDAPMNINISAYRVLFILLMLVRYRGLNTMELNRLLYENPVIGRVYNCETLTKYINTLREVGCQIPRSSSRNDYHYELVKTPFPLSLEPEEMAVAEKLLQHLAVQPNEGLYQDYRDFLDQLSWAVKAPRPESSEAQELPPLFPALEKRREQMNRYRRYCLDAFLLEIQLSDNGLNKLVYLEPHEVIERENRLLLLGYDPQTQQQLSLDVEQILKLRQMPSKNRRLVARTSVVFALYGRLAISYRLYPGEKIIYRSDQEIHVKTQVSETAGLMSRLLKYGEGCQVLSPDNFREAIRRHIDQLLATLLEDQ